MKATTKNTLIVASSGLLGVFITVAAMFLTKGPTHKIGISGTDNIASSGQSGGITADKVTINVNSGAAASSSPVAQRIDVIQNDNSILLDYDPIPESIRIIVGPLVHFPRPNYGYKLDGRKIFITHDQTLEQVKARIPSGGVTVEYVRKIDFKNDTQPDN